MPVTFSSELTIAAPRERVWAALVDLDSWGKWMPNFISCEKLTSGPFDVGFQWRETRKMFGKPSTEQFEVTGCEPPSKFELYVDGKKGTSGNCEFRFHYTLTPEAGSTKLRLDGEFIPVGKFAQVMGRLMIGAMKKGCTRDMDSFKSWLEGKTAPAVGH